MIEDKYYKPVEQKLFERQCYEWDRLGTGRTEELPSEMAERHAEQVDALERRRVTLNHNQWFELYPYTREQIEEKREI